MRASVLLRDVLRLGSGIAADHNIMAMLSNAWLLWMRVESHSGFRTWLLLLSFLLNLLHLLLLLLLQLILLIHMIVIFLVDVARVGLLERSNAS